MDSPWDRVWKVFLYDIGMESSGRMARYAEERREEKGRGGEGGLDWFFMMSLENGWIPFNVTGRIIRGFER